VQDWENVQQDSRQVEFSSDHQTIVTKREAVTGAQILGHYSFVTLQVGQILNPMYGVV
jgi:hypothetical protein